MIKKETKNKKQNKKIVIRDINDFKKWKSLRRETFKILWGDRETIKEIDCKTGATCREFFYSKNDILKHRHVG